MPTGDVAVEHSDREGPVRALGSFLSRRRALVALCMGTNLAEACVLLAAGQRTGLYLAAQASAPAPFGIFHDLRWLIVYHLSVWSFALEAAGAVALRSVLTALALHQAWPDRAPRPRLGRLALRSAGFTLGATALLLPWTVMLFGLAAFPVSWIFFAAVPSFFVVALLVHQAAISREWWRRPPAGASLAWFALSFVVLSASSAVVSAAPSVLVVPLAGLVGLYNAWAWTFMVEAVVMRAPARRLAPVVPLALAGFLGLVVGGSTVGFSAAAGGPGPGAGAVPTPAGTAGRQAVLVVAGYWSRWDGSRPLGPPLPAGYWEVPFSYRGLDRQGQPLAYRPSDTDRSLGSLERTMAEEVGVLAARTGRPVDILAESEGSLVAKAYLESVRRPPVATLVMVSPLLDPGRVYYPPAGVQGWGTVGGRGLELLSSAVGGLAAIRLDPQLPFMRSVVDGSPGLASLMSCPLPGVRQVVVEPLADAVASPAVRSGGLPTVVVAGFHGGLLKDPSVRPQILAALEGREQGSGWLDLADGVIKGAASAWQVPSLAQSLDARGPAPACR
ncbi:MAG TPA: hypothetical protein VKY15_05455 [Acidimicrobiales bacterium]|nr:hypothetical protein [Acidimicrobiales bacterium]